MKVALVTCSLIFVLGCSSDDDPMNGADAALDSTADTATPDGNVGDGAKRDAESEAGMADASMEAGADAAVDSSMPHQSCLMNNANVVFCADFETELGNSWTVEQLGGAVERSASEGRMNGGGLIATTSTGGDYARADHGFNATSMGEIWTRAYIKLSVVPSAEVTFLKLNRPARDQGLALYVEPDGKFAFYNDFAGMGAGSSGGALTAGSWLCVESRTTLAPTNGVTELFIDGQSVAQSTYASLPANESLSWLSLGQTFSKEGLGATEVAVDDVVVSTTRVPCE